MSPQLNCPHRNTDDAIFRHPAASNLVWRDARSMLGSMAKVARELNGNLKDTRNAQALVLHPAPDKDPY